MSFNGSGTFLINSTGQPVVANTVISATVFNALTADLASGLTNCITKDGQSTPTANIPMGSNKITGLANGTLASDAATLGQVQTTAAKLIGSVSGVDTVTGVMSPTLTAYAAGQLFYFVAAGANTGAVTLNIDGLGAKAVTRDGSTALAAGDINSGEIVVVIYDGTRFQMINAANSFGNTTINGTLTVTGNTGLQANVSITSALSVHGTFNVSGAAALGSTLAVTGKSDLPTVSTASVNAAVAAITTATVTNLTATSASVASVNAGVALLTTATVTDLTASSASIASANIGNLQFTAASIASINAGVAVVTNLTATSASIASANVGTAVITTGTVTNLTSTSASIASANAAVALVTTGTVTNLTSTAASIASANLGTAVVTTGTVTNLTATSASIASANAGTAVVTNLTATGASIASANVGTGVVTALTVTGASIASANVGTGVITTLTATGASVASINAGVALVTTGTVTNLTSTTASIASANIGVAAIGTLSFTGASIASLNAGTATITTGNLTFSSTAQRITGDMSNATVSNRLAFQTNTTNGNTTLNIIPNGTGTASQFVAHMGSDPANTSRAGINVNSSQSAALVFSDITGTGTYLPLTFYTGGSERMRLDTSGNLGIGTTASSTKLDVQGARWTVSSGYQGVAFLKSTDAQAADVGAGLILGGKYDGTNITEFAQVAGVKENSTSGNYAGAMLFYTRANGLSALYERMRIDSSGNVGIGTTTTGSRVRVVSGVNVNAPVLGSVTNYPVFLSNTDSAYGLGIGTNASDGHVWLQAQRSDSAATAYNITLNEAGGNVGIGTASPSTGVHLNRASGNTYYRAQNGTANADFGVDSAGTGILWNNSNYPIAFGTNNTERMRVTSDGALLVGTTTNTGTHKGFFFSASAGPILACQSTYSDYADLISFYSAGTVVKGTIAGNGSTAVLYNTTSDRRLKINIAPANDASSIVDAIQIVQHDWKVGGHTRYGVVAQDLYEVVPEAISKGDDGDEIEKTWGVDYSKLVPILVKEVQSLRQRVAELEAK